MTKEESAGELRIRLRAVRDAVPSLRLALRSFLTGLGLERETIDDVLTAVGESVANAVEHAYAGRAPEFVELVARREQGALYVEVADTGTFVERQERFGRGYGLKISRAIARTLEIDTSSGTRIRMSFRLR